MLKTTDVSVKIAGRNVVDEVSLECKPAQMIALTGPSGCGKTTLLNCLGLLIPPTSGLIEIDGEHAEKWSARKRRLFWQDKAAFIYQDYGLIDEESVDFNVRFRRAPLLRKHPKPEERLTDILTTVGLADRSRSRAAVLSGGEKQRVGIARAMYKKASYIFADEPTASLDADNRRKVTDLLLASAREGACVIIATHDEELAALADRRYRLDTAD